MESITVRYYSREPHISQVLTGFCMLARQQPSEYQCSFLSAFDNSISGAYVEAEYRGKRIIYDLMDGYQDIAGMQMLLDGCDFYFKRSYSPEKNEELLCDAAKMRPLGLNYHVSCKGHPVDKPFWKEQIKRLVHIENNTYSNTYFSADKFEDVPSYKEKEIQVMFAARLWEPDRTLPDKLNVERCVINQMRIQIIRALKEMKTIEFLGGLSDTPLSREQAPELILPEQMTNRRSYLHLLHRADICIATMGLHESIGWKLGEYVAASKAIVSEPLHYQVPGDFYEGKNYVSFVDAAECVDRVRSIADSPQTLYKMKLANREYYCKYVKPDQLIKNTLQIVDREMER